MAYNKKTWTNRTSEYPNRYRMTSVNGNIADVAIVPNEGNVTAEGDKFSADTMNDMETRIKNGFDSADSSISTLNTTLRGLISSEQTRATGVETLIQADVDALESNLANEVSRATGAETTLTNNLASEVTRATGVENGHNTRITSLEGRMDNAESDIDTLESAIAGFQTSLDTEVTRATEAEAELRGDVTNLNSAVSDLEAITTRAYKASGSVYFVDLPAAVESRQGNIYDILDAFTTTSEFLEGPGKEYPAHTDVVIVGVEGDYYNEVTPSGEENPSEEGWYVYDSTEEEYVLTEDTSVQSGTTYYSYANVKYMYNIGTGFFDTSNFVQKTDYATLLAAGIVKPDGTTTSIDTDGTIHSLGGGQGTAEAAERMIAPIEPDATASTKAYTIGQRLILNDVLYKAKTAIAVGDELVVDTNIELADNISSTTYNTDDSASTTINDTDYVPMSTSSETRKKALWSTIIAKIKAALATVATSGSYNDLSNKPNYAGSSSEGGPAKYVSYQSGNEINFKGGKQLRCWFNYRNADTGQTEGTSENIEYFFGNYSATSGKSNLNANSFNGVRLALSGSTPGYYNSSGTFVAFRKPTGNATAAQVLSGYTFSNASSDGLTGTFKHTSTATPTGGDLNNSQYNLGEQHSFRYVNTAVCYTRGSQHYANNRSGYASANNTSELRFDLYDIKPSTIINIRTTDTTTSYITIRDGNNSVYVNSQVVDSNHSLSYTIPSSITSATVCVYARPTSSEKNMWFWWTVSNSSY